jgi:hypothetical protein
MLAKLNVCIYSFKRSLFSRHHIALMTRIETVLLTCWRQERQIGIVTIHCLLHKVHF